MSSGSAVQVDLGYVKSPPGILKIVEFVLLLIAFACLADTPPSLHNSRYHFFMFVTVTLWLLVILLFILFLTKLHERVNVPWVILMIIFSGMACIALLISSSLIADDAADLHKAADIYGYYNVNYCDAWKCGNYDAAAAFGFFSLIAFALDCAFYIWKFIRNRDGGQPTGTQQANEPEKAADPEMLP